MFGVVPRVLWERVCPPDELNRIRMNMNCVFIETRSEKILIETGIGEKWNEKESRMYGIFREKPLAETLFEKTGYPPDDITIVVNTHLHFDHAGGNTIADPSSSRSSTATEALTSTPVEDRLLNGPSPSIPQFRNARYFVSESEFRHAQNPHERDRASYLSENWQPLIDSGQLELKPDSYEVVDGLRMEAIRGHSETMQTWRLDRGGKTVYGFADLIPMRHHIALPWIMGYDLYPTETLEFKKTIIPKAVREGWLCLFYHDIDTPLCRLIERDKKIAVDAVSV